MQKPYPYNNLTLCQKLKFQKTSQNPFYKSFRVALCKKLLEKKPHFFEKWDHFENKPSCKGYSPCKIPTLSQKSNFKKTCHNPFCKSFRVVLCKNPLKKNTKYSSNETILKTGPCKILTLRQKLKFQKTCQNPFQKSCRVVRCKKSRLQKHQIFEKWDYILKMGHHAKAKAHAKYSLWVKN